MKLAIRKDKSGIDIIGPIGDGRTIAAINTGHPQADYYANLFKTAPETLEALVKVRDVIFDQFDNLPQSVREQLNPLREIIQKAKGEQL